MEHHAALEIRVASCERGIQQRRWRIGLIGVELGITLVRGDDEVVLVSKLNRTSQLIDRHHCATRVAGRAQIQQLHSIPNGGGDRIEIWKESILGGRVKEIGDCAGEQRCTLVDLVERVRHRHERLRRRIDHGLRKGKERLTSTVDRQYGIETDAIGAKTKAPLEPAGAGAA